MKIDDIRCASSCAGNTGVKAHCISTVYLIHSQWISQLPAEQVPANPIEGGSSDKGGNQPGDRASATSQATGDSTPGTGSETG